MATLSKYCLAGLIFAMPLTTLAARDPDAALKLQIQIDSGVIKVSDLWANAGAKADTVIGQAPPPGRTIAIGTSQLAFIAQLYDVNWRPVSGVEHASLGRAGRPLTRDEMIEPLRRSLVEAGAPPSVAVDVTSVDPILVPPLSVPVLTVEGMSYDAAGEHFSAQVLISAPGMADQAVRLAGRAADMVPSVVANRRLSPGEVIMPADIRLAQVPQRRLGGPVTGDVSLVVGLTPKHAIVAGQPVSPSDVAPPILVAKGSTVVIAVETPTMSLAAQGIAMTAGSRGDTIQVMNPLSRAIVEARVINAGRAVIEPGSAPIAPPRANARPKAPEISN
jgi:flagella basal body P-ring formation protein FlgA